MHFCCAKAPLFLHTMQKTKDHPEHFVNNLGLTQCFGQNFHHFARVLWVFAFLRWFHQNQLFFHCMLQCLIQHHMNALHHAGTQSTFFQLRLWKCQGRQQHLSCSSSTVTLPASDTVSGSLASFLPFRESKFVFEWPRRITQSKFFILFSSRSHGGRAGLAGLPIRAVVFWPDFGGFFQKHQPYPQLFSEHLGGCLVFLRIFVYNVLC